MDYANFQDVISRKSHRCEICGTEIPSRTKYLKSWGVFDGRWWEAKAHHDCADMHAHHNRGRSEDDQCDDYYLDEYRGRWPHAVCRIELRQQIRANQ